MGLFKLGFSFSGFSIPIIWEICIFIDSIIYKVADWALNAFFKMALLSSDTSVFGTQVESILSRVMVLAGVFALFRLAVMLVNYIINPDKTSELSKSGTGIIKNIVIAVVLLVALPTVFDVLGRFQGMVVEDNVIPKIIYGYEKANTQDIKSQSKQFVNRVFLLFFTPQSLCTEGSTAYYCEDYIRVSNGQAGIASLTEYASSNLFSYTPFISGLMGMTLCYYFFVFAIELGVRLVKIVVLQVISPIPIIMSIDPSQKDRLSTFGKSYFALYIQIFLRILTLYLAFVILSLITNSSYFTDAINTGMLLEGEFFIKILLYIGIFQAAKELPKLIEEALGLKLGLQTGGKSFGAILGGIAGGAVGLAGGAVAGAAAGGLGGAFAGAASGMFSGAVGAAGSKNIAAGIKSSVASVKGAYATGGKIASAGGLGMYALSGAQNFLGGKRRDEATLKAFDKEMEDKDKLIAGSNKKIGDINKDIGKENQALGFRDRASQLRSQLQSTMEKNFTSSSPERASLQSYLNNNGELAQMRSDYNKFDKEGKFDNDVDLRQRMLSDITRKEQSLAEEYEGLKETHFQKMFTDNRGTDAEFESALQEYNDYVSSHGMSDRIIGSYGGAQDGFEHADALNESDKVAIQAAIDQKYAEISNEEIEIVRIENEKKAIEGKKKSFENNPQVKARANRGESKPNVKPRNTDM